MDADEEKITGILRRLGSKGRGRHNRSNCPSEESLAVFLNGDLAGAARDQLEAHLAQCAACADDLVATYQSAQPGALGGVPQRLIEKALALVPSKGTLFDLTVRLLRDSIELIRTSGRVIPVPVPVLRGEAVPSHSNMLQVEQEVGRFRVAVELDLSEAGLCQVTANVTGETGKPAEGVRLSLSSGDREQASFLTRGGILVFDRISPGEYSIAVSESGTQVGRIRLNLMMEK
jgi:anti-sigma factor RsiW